MILVSDYATKIYTGSPLSTPTPMRYSETHGGGYLFVSIVWFCTGGLVWRPGDEIEFQDIVPGGGKGITSVILRIAAGHRRDIDSYKPYLVCAFTHDMVQYGSLRFGNIIILRL